MPSKNRISFTILLSLSGLLGSCATIPAERVHRDVSALVAERSGAAPLRAPSDQGPSADEETLKRLRKRLSVQDAVDIALRNNGTIQAKLQELGIGRGDAVQAGLPENPEFSLGLGFSHTGSGGPLPHIIATQNVLDFYLASLRKKAAVSQLEETKLGAADAVLGFVQEVKEAYYALQALEHFRSILRDTAHSARTGASLSERQIEAGNVNRLELSAQKVVAEQAEIELVRTEGDLRVARESLAELLGIQNVSAAWAVQERLPSLPGRDPSLQNLEQLALGQRLDLAAARQRTKTLEHDLKLAGWQAFPSLHLGVESEKDPDGATRTGPEIGFQVPLFNRGQGNKEKLRAQMLQQRYAIDALENRAITEVKTTRSRLTEAREVAQRYRDRLIPLLEETIQQTLLHYNFMLKGPFDLLQARREQLAAQREYLGALKDYWIERAHLEKAVGGSINVGQRREVRPTERR